MARDLTIFEAAHVLGCMPAEARRLLEAHGMAEGKAVQATVSQVEDLALDHYPWNAHTHDIDYLSAGSTVGALVARR